MPPRFLLTFLFKAMPKRLQAEKEGFSNLEQEPEIPTRQAHAKPPIRERLLS